MAIHKLLKLTKQSIAERILGVPTTVLQLQLKLQLRRSGLIISLLATSLCIGIRQLGWLESLELIVFDNLLQLQPRVEADPRILIVAIRESDIQDLNQWPITDLVLAQALATLQKHNPKVLGLDIYRDIPQEPGHATLREQLNAPNLIAIETVGSIPGPPGVPPERVGFNDVLLDSDGIVRRNLMSGTVKGEQLYSFALRISLTYLTDQEVPLAIKEGILQIGRAQFKRLTSTSGGYQFLDDAGHQVMLQYRPAVPVARQISLTQVLEGNFQPEWIQDKVVLIGATADSANDSFLTPFTRANNYEALTSGVILHAHMLSQFLSIILDNQKPIWFLPDWVEIFWMLAWVTAGSILGWRLRHPLSFSAWNITAIASLGLLSYGAFLRAMWLPTISPLLGVIISQGFVIAYKRFYDATHDTLTGLINRRVFIAKLRRLIVKSEKDDSHYAVIFVSLKHFNIVNESLGFNAGDEVLSVIVSRIQNLLQGQETLARVGNDEFALFIREIQARQDVSALAEQISREIALPFEVNNQLLFLSSSIGVAFKDPSYKHHPEDLFRDAHIAMYRAKIQGKAHYEIFSNCMRQEKLVRMQLEADLRIAVERQELVLHYQPIIALKTGKIAGFEALVRWFHPINGLVSPADFIPVAEETGLIVPIGQWIFKTACRQMADWQANFPSDTPLMISINLSPGEFAQSNLAERIRLILESTKVQKQSVKIEITETMLMENVEGGIETLLQLKRLDSKIGMDDFGTGYSSFSYLTRLPIDTLKIDRSFIQNMNTLTNDFEVVRTIIMLGHNLGLDIIAEGVENREQLSSLVKLGCEYAQGYFMSKPLAANLATDLLTKDPTWRV